MKRSEAIAAFDTYVDQFDRGNPMICQKAVHSHKVAEIADRISRSLGREDLVDFAWLLGLLHDIGRFEQVKQYGTFADSQSVDHAELGADILFKDGLIEAFPTETLPEGWQNIAETAIRLHNKLTLPAGLDERTMTLSNILRDADKVDIFRVLIELSYADRGGGRKPAQPESCELSPEVMKCVKEHRCVPSNVRKNSFDRRVSHCCLAFELVYEESRRITREQGFLRKLLSMQDGDGVNVRNDKQLLQLEMVKKEIERAWKTGENAMEKYRHTVHYYETDRMGFTHHSNYVRWMEEARIDFFDQLGWSYQKFEDEGIISPVTAIECKYKQTTTFPENVYISVTVEGFRGLKLKLRYTMTNDAGSVVCEASSEHCFLGQDGRFVRIRKEYPEFWQALNDLAGDV